MPSARMTEALARALRVFMAGRQSNTHAAARAGRRTPYVARNRYAPPTDHQRGGPGEDRNFIRRLQPRADDPAPLAFPRPISDCPPMATRFTNGFDPQS